MIELNLVPDIKQEYLKAQKARNLVITAAIFTSIASAAVVAILVVVMLGQAVTGNVIDGSITSLSKQLASTNDLSKVLTIQNQLSKLSDMHSTKNIDSRLFPLLDAINPSAPNNVTITSAKVDATAKTIAIEGQATNMYQAAEALKKTIVGTTIQFNNADGKGESVPLVEKAEDVMSSDIGVSEDASGKKILRLTMTFTYPDVLFAESSSNAIIQSPARSNATDSYLRVPQSLFSGSGS